ncbi:hypothetical protein AB4144_03745, partial [Rhizobiaceae sp. 2RAB30]
MPILRTILRSKLAPRGLSFRDVPRPRLLQAILDPQKPALAILSAPAGFGKTTLLCQWRAALLEQGDSVAWLSLDESDDDPCEFAAALSAALKVAGIAVDRPGASWKQTLLTLIDRLEEVPTPLWLMLDELDRANSDGVGEAVTFLARSAPDHLRIVLAGRSGPTLPLAHMRAANRLLELSMSELRFDLDETRRFFQAELPAEVDLFDMDQLVELTQGWPAGLRMAAKELASAKRPKDAVSAFAGLSEHVRDYFEECVVANMPGEQLALLTRASILDELNPSLCASLAGPDGTGSLFAGLNFGELFADRIDEREEQFRLHPLFRKFLRSRLDRLPAEDPRVLHAKAAEWFADLEDWPRAVHHA